MKHLSLMIFALMVGIMFSGERLNAQVRIYFKENEKLQEVPNPGQYEEVVIFVKGLKPQKVETKNSSIYIDENLTLTRVSYHGTKEVDLSKLTFNKKGIRIYEDWGLGSLSCLTIGGQKIEVIDDVYYNGSKPSYSISDEEEEDIEDGELYYKQGKIYNPSTKLRWICVFECISQVPEIQDNDWVTIDSKNYFVLPGANITIGKAIKNINCDKQCDYIYDRVCE